MKQCNYCNRKHCTLISSHWNDYPWPLPRMEHNILKYNNVWCTSWKKINRRGLATFFEVAIENNPKELYDVLSKTGVKVKNSWTKTRKRKKK